MARTGSYIADTETIVAIPIYSIYLVHHSLQLAGPESPAAVSNGTVGAEKKLGLKPALVLCGIPGKNWR